MSRRTSKDKLLAEWFWTDRWQGSSGFELPLKPRGLYREMLTQAWRKGASLPADHETIRRICGVTEAEWAECWPVVEPFWERDGDRYVNRTQVEVYAEALDAYKRNRDRTTAATEARRNGQRDVQRDVHRSDVSQRSEQRDVERDVALTLNVTRHPPSPSPSPSLPYESGEVAAAPSEEQLQAQPGKNGAAAEMAGLPDIVSNVPVVVNDPFEEKPEDHERAERELVELCKQVATREGKEVREVLIEASRTPRGTVMTNPASASLDWICQTIGRLKAKIGPIISDNNRRTDDAASRVLARMLANPQGGAFR